LNVLIIAFLPIIGASLLLDRRSGPPPPSEPRRQLPNGARSGSGEPLTRPRPQPRIRRDKRAAQLETIVVEPSASQNSGATQIAANPELSGLPESEPSSARFLRSRRTRSESTEEVDSDVQQQLEAIEQEMAELEEQLKENGITEPTAHSEETPPPEMNSTVPDPEIMKNSPISGEEATSERQAIEEILSRLEQRKRAGGVDDETYQRLREKYLKRYADLG
ncbi:MAG: hypothetical protein Q6361_01315, partial [Candidatus Hermodarchaeota archaeon]|nr:hypothetical protein [Candidatus Hermodarchaeota archaeon]